MVSRGSAHFGGVTQGLFGGTEPPHVDPRFAPDRNRFRRERMGKLVCVGIIEEKSHLVPINFDSPYNVHFWQPIPLS